MLLQSFTIILLKNPKTIPNRTNQTRKTKRTIILKLRTRVFEQTNFLIYLKGLFWFYLLADVLHTHQDFWNLNFPYKILNSDVCSL